MYVDLMYQYFVKAKQKLVINRLKNHVDIYLNKKWLKIGDVQLWRKVCKPFYTDFWGFYKILL